ncbi:hypothetical protein CHARACLAT_025190 [Characodon lateralis]|uniref:Ankyrin-2 n=1 Tax=Characodon lateralis TaxID=208331 RepID=A0ABU7DAK9_9TELE|nr:hypothetical protein [Characodon lateralis]
MEWLSIGQPLPQDFFTKEIQGQAQQKDYLVLVSPSTFKTNISQSSKQSNVDMGQMQGFQVEKLLLTHDSNTAIIVSPIAPALDLVKTEYDIRMTSQSSFPQETYEYTESDPVSPETQDNGDEPTTMSSNSSPTPQESGSPQLDQLLPDLKEMKLKFSPERPDSYASESSDDSPEKEEDHTYEEPSSEEEPRPDKRDKHSEETMTPADYERFATESPSFQLKTDISSSASDEEYTIPLGDAETSFASVTYTSTPLRIAHGAHCIEDSPNLEYFDVEPYFDCKQGMCDFSETELNAPESTSSLNVGQAQHQPGHLGTQEKTKQKVLLSSGSEDYEDAPLVHESYHQGHGESKESLRQSETSDEEFTLCKTSQPSGTYYSNKSLQREVSAEFGSISESSDEEFLTTRIIRRVVIKVEQIADLPTESVTEETYRDENGLLVIKRVTRKVISKCVSVDGVEREEVPSEEAPQQSFTVADGDSCSKDTFPKSEGSLSSRQEKADLEKKTVVDGERTTTSQGDQPLASDLPSAQNDFQQGPHA